MALSPQRFTRRKEVKSRLICEKEERNASLKKVSLILQKDKDERTTDEVETLLQCSDIVEEIQSRWKKRDIVKQRLEEIEEPAEVLEERCKLLAQAIIQAHHLIVYTGAGISTAARIPDYRGKDGIWTRLQQGREIGNHDLTLAEPTYTHMALATLHKKEILKYVVSQNCDGLHLRSGLPKQALSELHGNMYIEVCKNCKPAREYWRLFDVTENTARYFHKTMRKCYVCNHALVDTIVHFGERGSLHWPLNWPGACSHAKEADVILCLGSSLKVLKKYPWLWQMDKPAKKRPNLYIVNLQWTPKDDVASVKIHGKCDQVMRIVMKHLGIEAVDYSRENDPIFVHASVLHELEVHTTTQPLLKSELRAAGDKEANAEQHIKIEQRSNELNSAPSPEPKLLINTNCDTKKDSNVIIKHDEQISIPNSIFSIDSILNSETTLVSVENNGGTRSDVAAAMADPNLQTLLTFYQYHHQMTTSLLHNHMFGYRFQDIGFYPYPYQTGYLYPGLHSIINPSPFYNVAAANGAVYRHENVVAAPPPTPVVAAQETVAAAEVVVKKPSCDYCNVQFQSVLCMYYLPIECTFVKQEFRFSKSERANKLLVCVCCDCSTDDDDDDDDDPDESDNKVMKTVDDCDVLTSNRIKTVNSCDVLTGNDDLPPALPAVGDCNNTSKVAKVVNAGWFGKGYKKNRKFKRKSM